MHTPEHAHLQQGHLLETLIKDPISNTTLEKANHMKQKHMLFINII